MLIDQERATERINYERYMKSESKRIASQTLMFPLNCSFSPADSDILDEIGDEIKHFGFEVDNLGRNNFVVSAVPIGLGDENVQSTLEQIISDYKGNILQQSYTRTESVALSLARRMSVKSGKKLQLEEIQGIITQLFACDMPDQSPSGKRIMEIIHENELIAKLK